MARACLDRVSFGSSGRFVAMALAAIVLGGPTEGAAADPGPVVQWGSGEFAIPASIDGTAGIASEIAAGGTHSCAIQAGTGAVICWGAEHDDATIPPHSVDGFYGTASAIAAGASHSCAIEAETGAVICWGLSTYGQATPPISVDGRLGDCGGRLSQLRDPVR